MAFLNLSKSRPDKHTNRNLWNESWENDLKIYEEFKKELPNIYLVDPRWHVLELNMEPDVVKIVERFRSDLLSLQADARRRITMRLATDGFAEGWAALTPKKRKDYIIDALYKTSSAARDFEGYRKWCPELTVDGLGQNPQAYIDLVMILIDSEMAVDCETRVTFFPHPVVDAIFDRMSRIKTHSTMLMIRLERTLFLTMVLWRVYLTFYDLDEICRFDFIDLTSKKAFYATQPAKELFSKEERKQFQKDLQESKATEKARGETKHCWGCGKSEALLPTSAELKACSNCKKIERTILYCSKECQKNDWKVGRGRPHKEICGKPFPEKIAALPVTAVGKPVVKGVQKTPDAHPSFKRSPQLLYQIKMLQVGTHPDYAFVLPHPAPDVTICIPDIDKRLQFLVARTQALKYGTSSAVSTMYRILRPYAKLFCPPDYDLKKQFLGEYGAPVQVVEWALEWKPSIREMEDAVELALSFTGSRI